MSSLTAFFFPGTLFTDRADIWMFLTLDVPHKNYYSHTLLYCDVSLSLIERRTSETVHDKHWGSGWFKIDAIYAI